MLKLILCLFLFALTFLLDAKASKFWSGDGPMVSKEIMVDHEQRRYYFYRPTSCATTQSLPVILAFHGGGGKAEGMDRCTGGLTKLADEKGFCVVFPAGIEGHWNDGRKRYGLGVPANHDDLKFVSLMLDELAKQANIDTDKIYATGISNGGFFSQYLALKLPGKIAAVASIAASVPDEFLALTLSKTTPVMFILGTKDPLVPWQGGRICSQLPANRGQVIAAEKSIEFWLGQNKNNSLPVVETLPDTDLKDDSQVVLKRYGNSGANNEVLLIEIQGGGHTWPSGSQYLPAAIIGPVCRDFNGNKLIWEFFAKHHLQLGKQ